MNLTILDRVVLARMLPQEGSIEEIRTCMAIANKIELSPEEQATWIDQHGGLVANCDHAVSVVSIEFCVNETSLIEATLRTYDAGKKINPHMLHLVGLFLEQ
jgi:hypothetical protein